MGELKTQLKSFIDEATLELGKYPLQEYRNWSTKLTNEENAHILFLHASLIYARGFYKLLKTEDINDRTLLMFCGVLSEVGCKPIGMQSETFFIHMMNHPYSVFSKYKWDIDTLFKEEIQEHHWSIGDITGSFVNYQNKVLPDNHGISEKKVFDFIRCKTDILSMCRSYLSDDSYFDLFTNWKADQVLLRRPLWVKCVDQQQFIESFSKKYPNISTTMWNLDNYAHNPQVLEEGVLFFIIPNNVPNNEKNMVRNLLSESQDLISKYTLLVVLDKQTIMYGMKIHDNDFLDFFDKKAKAIIPLFENQKLHDLIYNYGEFKVDETKYFDYFWVDK